jgi:hypothetical protein
MPANSTPQELNELDDVRPPCPTCGMPMWLTEIEHIAATTPKALLHFECVACDAKAIIPPLT